LRIVGDWLSGSYKVKQVMNISLEDMQPIPDWSLELVGTRTVTMSAASFVSMYYSGLHGPWFNYTDCGGMHAAYYNYTKDLVDYAYAGIPLWMLIAIVDGEDTDHYEFNTTLAAAGYSVNISALDYWTELSSSTVAFNNSIILAFMLDGELLTDDDYPLKLTGQWLLGNQKVKAVVKIELVGLPE
jgi:DMSO/TMAO reductase YedYZ molybdopterin-dependent catalytic subunit